MILAISGVPRDNGVSYTLDTITHVLQNGGVPKGMPVIVYDDVCRLGSARACHELLKRCYDLYPHESVLLLEDDVICARNAVAAALKYEAPRDVEMVTFYNNRIRFTRMFGAADIDWMHPAHCRITKHLDVVPGTYLMPASKDFCYAQALRLSGRLVKHIAESKWPDDESIGIDWRDARVLSPFSIRDRVLGHFASEISKQIALVVPNWFEHIGDLSAVVNPDFDPTNRCKHVKAGNFISTEHDALTDDVSQVHLCLPELVY